MVADEDVRPTIFPEKRENLFKDQNHAIQIPMAGSIRTKDNNSPNVSRETGVFGKLQGPPKQKTAQQDRSSFGR